MRELHVFCSDVHLVPGGDAITARFLAFLASVRDSPRVAELHVLGDLFEYWLGWGHERLPDFQPILSAFREVREAGVRIDVIWGNRDFLLHGRPFERRSGILVRGDERRLRIGGRAVKLRHGDLLCANDVGYQRFRRVIRSIPVQLAARLAPLAWKRAVARRLREASQRSMSRKTMREMDFDEAAIRALYRDDTEVVVCGHIHREQRREVPVADREAELYVLGSWHHEAPFLIADGEGRFRFARDRVD